MAALANTIDYTDLIFEAVKRSTTPSVRDRWRASSRLVVVDEYQDTDPLQVELLQALAGDGRDLVVVGDPYQSIYGFRGADVRGIIDFPDAFATAAGPAPRLTLGYTNRYGDKIAAAVRSIVDNKGALGAVDGAAYAALRNPTSKVDDPGAVDVRTFSTPTAEAEHIALLLREAHLHDHVPWRDMAVLVRSGTAPRRGCSEPWPPPACRSRSPATSCRWRSSRRCARCWPRCTPPTRSSRGETLDARRRACPAHRARWAISTRPACAGSAARCARPMPPTGEAPRASRLLIAEALGDPALLPTLDVQGPPARAAEAAARLSELLRKAADQISAGESAEQVLWTVWDGTRWPTRLQAEAEGDGDGSARANHDLDAVCALFAEAARAEEREAHRSVAEVARALEAQQIPAEHDRAERRLRRRGAAHDGAPRPRGSNGRWSWSRACRTASGPTCAARGSLLQGDRLSPDGVLPPPSPWAAAARGAPPVLRRLQPRRVAPRRHGGRQRLRRG